MSGSVPFECACAVSGIPAAMRFGVLALLLVPGACAAAVLVAAIPAGDAIDDSAAILLGAPSLLSGLATFALGHRRDRAPAVAGGWALASAIAAAVLFGVLFVALAITVCAFDSDTRTRWNIP